MTTGAPPPLLWWQTIQSPFENNVNRMGTKNFQSPHFVPFQLPPCDDWNFFSCHKDGQLKKFDWPILWWLKIFNCQHCGAPQFFNCPSLWWPKLFSHHKRGVSKAFQKHMTRPPLLATKKYSIAIAQCWSLGWWPNFFNYPLTHPHHQMATEIFQLLKGVWTCVIILEKQPLLSFLGD
jgi:hypothetical protein